MKQLFKNEEINFKKKEGLVLLNKTNDEINEKYIKGEVRIITEQARYPLTAILGMVNSENYILNPEFQRRHRWSNDKKSRLIESFIMNVPIPPIFLYEIKYSIYEVMDGLQRMTAISQFYRNEFRLEGLQEWSELNGMYYGDLPEQIRKGIDRRYLSSIILLQETAKSEEEANRLKQLVFERINSGGEKLTAQESRNALFPGPLNSLCIHLARFPLFCRMWDIPEPDEFEYQYGYPRQEVISNLRYSKMEDAELVLRFFAYRQIEKWDNDLELFLDEFLKAGNNFDSSVLDTYTNIFLGTVHLLYEIYGEKAFWLWRSRQNKQETIHYERPTKILYDPLMYVVSDMLQFGDILVEKRDMIVEQTSMLHKENAEILAGRNTNRNDVLKRIEVLKRFFYQFI